MTLVAAAAWWRSPAARAAAGPGGLAAQPRAGQRRRRADAARAASARPTSPRRSRRTCRPARGRLLHLRVGRARRARARDRRAVDAHPQVHRRVHARAVAGLRLRRPVQGRARRRRAARQDMTWADTHHPTLSETNGDYDGQYLFIDDKANARIAVINLQDFATVRSSPPRCSARSRRGVRHPEHRVRDRGLAVPDTPRRGVRADRRSTTRSTAAR